jgi:hypothetical protein
MPAHDLFVFSADGMPAWVTSEEGSLLGARGPAVLAGLVMRVLFTTEGSCPTARGEGTQLPAIAGSPVDLGQVESAVVAAIQHTEQYLKRLQGRYPYPRNETLSELTVLSVELTGASEVKARILIKNLDGAAFSTTVLLGE